SAPVQGVKVSHTTSANVYEAAFWSRDVGMVVVDVDRQGLALVHNLHTLYPGLRIVAVTRSPAKAAVARRARAAPTVLRERAAPGLQSGSSPRFAVRARMKSRSERRFR